MTNNANIVNNDILASAMRTIINGRATIEWHTPDNNKPAGLSSSAALEDEYNDVHLVVNGRGVTISEFVDEDEFHVDESYGSSLLRAVAALNAATKVLENDAK